VEHHGIDSPGYEDSVEGVPKPFVGKDGCMEVPDGPGLGITLNEQAIKDSLRRGGGGRGGRGGTTDPDKLFFPPSDEWNGERSSDRLWSLGPLPKSAPTA
jgi:hypothetical protein